MQVLGQNQIAEFYAKHPDSKSALESWLKVMKGADFRHLPALRSGFNSVDYVPPHHVFNIGGNKFRLSALIDFQTKIVKISSIMLHAEYDKRKWRKKK